MSVEQKQPAFPPPISLPSNAGDVGASVGGGAGDQSENAVASTLPSTSPIDLISPWRPPPVIAPFSKKRNGRRKKNPLTPKQRAAANRRIEILSEKFRPVPFSPGKNLDFSAHENLFRELGLWDFAHLKLDSDVRSDLLIDLISYYNPTHHRSYVHDLRINVSRGHLARALRLPIKKVKANGLECIDESVCVLLEFISNYMPYGDDMFILPREITQAIQFVKEGRPQKVDWAALMWVLVEKELFDAPKSGICYCASHLQCLIKRQQPRLFQNEEGPVIEPVVETEGDEVMVVEADVCVADGDKVTAVKDQDDDYDSSSIKMSTLEDLENALLKKNNGELPLPLDEEEDVMEDFEEAAGQDKELLEEVKNEEVKNEGFEHCLHRCSSGVADGIKIENFTKVDEKNGQEMKCGDDLSVKFSNLVRLSSSDFLQEMGNTTYGQQLNSFGAPTGEFFTGGAESHKNEDGHAPSLCLYSVNNTKRHACTMSDAEEDHFDLSHQKRTRSCEPWDNLTLSPYELMQHLQGNVERVKMLYAEKSQVLENMQMETQYLNHVLQDKDQVIQSLKTTIEGQQQWRTMIRHYEHEMNLLTKMFLGYKKSWKVTQSNFAEYKRKHLEGDETLNNDFPRVRELEQIRLRKEEEARRNLQDGFGILEKVLVKFKECEERIMIYNRKLVELAGEVKELKGRFAKSNSPSK